MPGSHRMSKRESESALWDIRDDDSARTVEVAGLEWSPVPFQERILQLRAALYRCQKITRSPEIRRIIANELASHERLLLI